MSGLVPFAILEPARGRADFGGALDRTDACFNRQKPPGLFRQFRFIAVA
jgi:hypothetical protein